jgi:D-arabinose 1-dehydrogenase-like Zn-dependent alcohol dehydrogenase
LNPEGIYVGAGIGPGGSVIGFLARAAVIAPVLSRFVSQKFVIFITRITKEDLTVMRDLMEARKVTPVIERRYRLSEVPEAIRYLSTGHAQAKLVISLESIHKT